jgi:hypothetical protein
MTLPRRTVLVVFLLAAALSMGLSLRNGFVYDDLPAIVNNPRVTDPTLWHTIPSSPYWLGTLWRPVTVSLFALQWWIGHGAPWFFHFVSLAGYVGVAALGYALLRRLRVGAIPAALVGVLFLLHPVHVEVVASAVGQSEIWTAIALVAATIVYWRARERGVTTTAVLALLAFVAIAIMSKEQGFVAPILLAGVEWILVGSARDERADTRDHGASERLRLLIPVSALAVLLFVLRANFLNSFTGETPAIALRKLSIGGRFITFLGVIPEYARLLVWPMRLQADYGPPGVPVGGAFALRHAIGAGLLIAYVTLFLRWRRQNPVAAFGLFWAAVALAPVSNLITPSGIVMAERVLFLPSIGIAMAAAAAIAKSERKAEAGEVGEKAAASSGHRVLVAAVITWGLLLTVRSATRVPTWGDQRRFFSRLTVDAPRAYRAWKVSGEYWDQVGEHARARENLRRSLQLWPHDYEVNERLGQYLRADGQCEAAIPIFAAGVEHDPDVTSLRAKLIECLIAERRWDDAARYADDALKQGQPEFQSMRERVTRLRGAADSSVPGKKR